MAHKANPATRHVTSINDLSDKDIDTIFELTQSYLNELPDPHFPYRIGRSTKVASNFILASLFYEPSTRTRLSFESAMLRLGGEVITSADPATSSAAGRASPTPCASSPLWTSGDPPPRDGAPCVWPPIFDRSSTAATASRHPPRRSATSSRSREPQASEELKVAISGDLRGSRTIHSFVYAPARFRQQSCRWRPRAWSCRPMSTGGCGRSFAARLFRRQQRRRCFDRRALIRPEPHQQSLFAGPEIGRPRRRR